MPTVWERPCVAKGPQGGPSNVCSVAETWGCYRSPSRRKAAPTGTALVFRCLRREPQRFPRIPYQRTPQIPSKVAFGPGAPRALMHLPDSPGTRRGLPMWNKPAFTDLRIGFEVTMYFANR